VTAATPEGSGKLHRKQKRIFNRINVVPRAASALAEAQGPVKPERRAVRGPHFQKKFLNLRIYKLSNQSRE
jgi:hypothetical protein